MTGWSTPNDIHRRLKKAWDNGRILASFAGGDPVFPIRIPLRTPGTRALSDEFEAARKWIRVLTTEEKQSGGAGYLLEWREFRHPQLGANRIPIAAMIESERDGLTLIGKQREAERFRKVASTITGKYPALSAWVAKRPLAVLEHVEAWPKLLAVIEWIVLHPRPSVYLRQIDAPGVDTKFIERYRTLLGELLDFVLPPEGVDTAATGGSGFERRYGFRSKPAQIRFRLLDPALHIRGLSDLSVTSDEFARLDLPDARVFITENEINFLAFPPVPRSMILFGAGYGFESLVRAEWLGEREIFYWGDIDTHGFAILDQLRALFPKTESLMMDRETLLEHRSSWGREAHPTGRDLNRLTPDESALYDDLRFDRLAPALRLEQERIGFAWAERELSPFGRKGLKIY